MQSNFRDFINSNLILEMAGIGGKKGLFIGIDTSFTTRKGEPYFKVYNTQSYSSQSRVVSVSFTKPKLIFHHRNNLPWADFDKQDMKKVINFFNEMSNKSENPHTNWEYAIITYNRERFNYSESKTEQLLEFTSEADPLPINLEMPDYLSIDFNAQTKSVNKKGLKKK